MTVVSTGGGGTRSVLNALRVLEVIAAHQPVGVSELARAVDMPKSTTQRTVLTLHQARWLELVGGEPTRWRLSYKALTVGLASTAATGLEEVALERMRPVRDELGETMHLAVPDGDDLIVIGRLDGTQPLRAFLQVGTRAPLQVAASGRAMLAAMTDAEVARVLDAGLRRYTDRTVVDRSSIASELDRTRDRGYAINEGEWRDGIAAVGAAVLARDGRPVAGISVSMPLSRFRELDVDHIAQLIMTAASETGQLLRSY